MRQIDLTADADARLDVLVAQGAQISRSQAAKWIEAGCCRLNGATPGKAGTAVRAGDHVTVLTPDVTESPVTGEDIPIRFLYQDEELAVVDKPCGMVVHPANGNESGTLVNALLFALDAAASIDDGWLYPPELLGQWAAAFALSTAAVGNSSDSGSSSTSGSDTSSQRDDSGSHGHSSEAESASSSADSDGGSSSCSGSSCGGGSSD